MRRAALAALLLLLLLQPAGAAAQEPTAAQHLASVPLTIGAAGRVLHYRVEVARTFEEQEIGLMFRPVIPRQRGMIFPMDPPRMANFWMKNTLAPLDIVFIRPDGTIGSIAAQATPLSLKTIGSGEPVSAVLELAGGEAQRAGIKPGDRVRWRPH
jgi:uncharacterized protein